jgi:hypothetical protein
MTGLATKTTTTANGVANGPEASQVFHVEHRCGRTGHRVELARYTVGGGEERILFGQRVDGVVRFLPDDLVVLVLGRALSEDSSCRSRGQGSGEARMHAVRRKRPNVVGECDGAAAECLEGRS